ncbi:MAG: NAD(+) synthase [Anaerolineae bacterium]|nr:NAD(+) synthase [Anaerolineae bacterium]
MDEIALAHEIAAWMRHKLSEAGADGYVVGLSGGIDSATTAALAVRAGAGVLGVWMPCYSVAEDERYARMVAQALSLDLISVDLCAPYDAILAALPEGSNLARANLKPRLRMSALYYLAQSRSYLVAGTGNKAEIMVGYFTKYGDAGVDIEPLGELYKHEVRALASVLGVPQPIIDRAPSPGLWPGQTDEGEMGITYAEIDAILAAWDRGQAPDLPADRIAKVEGMMARTAHKRAMPPSFPVTR